MFEDDDWGDPVAASGEFARVQDLQQHLLIVFPIGYIEHSPTRFTVPGKPSDVIVCDIVDLDAADENGNPGKIYRTAWWRPSKIIVTLRPWINKRVLGRISKGVATNGMNPPWIIDDAKHEPGAIDRARAWAQANPNFAVSPFTPPRALVPQDSNGSQPDYGSGYRGPSNQQQFVQPQGYPQQAPPQQYQPQGPPPQPQFQQAPQYPQGPPQQGYQQGPPPQQGYQQGPPAPQYQQGPPQNPQFQQAAQPAPQYQQGPPQQQVPAYPVQGAQEQNPQMLELMRAQRMRREAEPQDIWQDTPPF